MSLLGVLLLQMLFYGIYVGWSMVTRHFGWLRLFGWWTWASVRTQVRPLCPHSRWAGAPAL